jgi:hypothetical protein
VDWPSSGSVTQRPFQPFGNGSTMITPLVTMSAIDDTQLNATWLPNTELLVTGHPARLNAPTGLAVWSGS